MRQLPLYIYRKQVQFDVSIEVLASFTAKDSPSGNTHGDSEVSMATITLPLTPTPTLTLYPNPNPHQVSMVDVANSICLLRGLPVPRHSEGGFVSALLASVASSRWVAHFEDLLQQRWC